MFTILTFNHDLEIFDISSDFDFRFHLKNEVIFHNADVKLIRQVYHAAVAFYRPPRHVRFCSSLISRCVAVMQLPFFFIFETNFRTKISFGWQTACVPKNITNSLLHRTRSEHEGKTNWQLPMLSSRSRCFMGKYGFFWSPSYSYTFPHTVICF